MRTRQWEPCFAVIERSPRPTGRRMAHRAIRWETSRHMVRIRRLVEIVDVARGTGRRRPRELAVDVATRARHGHVRTCQRERRKCIVIKSRRGPCRR